MTARTARRAPVSAGGQRGGQDGAVGGHGRGVTAPALIGKRDINPAPVQIAQAALHQAVLLAAFGVIERRSRDPLLPFGIFRSASLTRANLCILALFGSYVSFQFLVTQYLRTASGWTALGTALAFLPAGVLVAVASPRVGPLLDRFGPALMVTVALGCLVAGYALFLRIGPHPDYPGVILPSVLLIGAAFGLGFSALNVQATAGVADAEQGPASGILQTSLQIGGALVLAIVTAVVDAHGGNRLAAPQALLSAYRPALEVITGVAAVGRGHCRQRAGLPRRPQVRDRAAAARRGDRTARIRDGGSLGPVSDGLTGNEEDPRRQAGFLTQGAAAIAATTA